jgi:Tfp pilus assembly protein PilO
MIKVDDAKTWLPMSKVISLMMFAVGSAAWATAVYSKIETRVTQAEKEIVTQENSKKELIVEIRKMNDTLVEIKTVLKQQERRVR